MKMKTLFSTIAAAILTAGVALGNMTTDRKVCGQPLVAVTTDIDIFLPGKVEGDEPRLIPAGTSISQPTDLPEGLASLLGCTD